jgi:signal transduction histidine kinase
MASRRSKPAHDDAEALRRRIDELERELENAQVSGEDAQQQAERYASELEALEQGNHDLETKLRSREKACSSLRERNRELNTKIEEAEEALRISEETLSISNEDLRTHMEELQATNEELQASTEEIEAANEELQASNDELDLRVQQRTAELEKVNESLQEEVARRKVAEEELRLLNDELEQRIAARTKELRESQAKALRNERLAALGQLAATVSHELRNPLGVIANSLEMVDVKTREHDLGVARHIDRIKRGIYRCDRIISEMLDYARDRELMTAATDVDAWLTDLLNELDLPDWVELRYEPHIRHAVAEVDKGLLRGAILNLVENAGDALLEQRQEQIDRTRAEIVVESNCSDGILSVTVRDSGPGMSKDVQAAAFEPLFSTKTFGVGLGLAVVRKAVVQHGGSVELESQAGQGTRITLKIPMAPAAVEA